MLRVSESTPYRAYMRQSRAERERGSKTYRGLSIDGIAGQLPASCYRLQFHLYRDSRLEIGGFSYVLIYRYKYIGTMIKAA